MEAREVVGAVLAGGRGSRLGGGKGAVTLAGRPLASYPVAALRRAGIAAVAVVAKAETQLPDLGVPVIREPDDLHHPLAGVLAALDAAGGRPVVVVAADMPFLSPALLRAVAWDGDPGRAAAPRVQGAAEPLCARYPAGARPALAAALHRRAPLRAALEGLEPLEIPAPDPEELFNVNTRADLAVAEERLRAGS